MFEFAWPWLFLLLPLPLFVRYFLPKAQQQASAIRIPNLHGLSDGHRDARARPFMWLLLWLCWLLLVIAVARPQWL
ncbi:MAG TPA: IMP dehydrogenase, partial [Idiomarina sp.]